MTSGSQDSTNRLFKYTKPSFGTLTMVQWYKEMRSIAETHLSNYTLGKSSTSLDFWKSSTILRNLSEKR